MPPLSRPAAAFFTGDFVFGSSPPHAAAQPISRRALTRTADRCAVDRPDWSMIGDPLRQLDVRGARLVPNSIAGRLLAVRARLIRCGPEPLAALALRG